MYEAEYERSWRQVEGIMGRGCGGSGKKGIGDYDL